MNRTIDLVNIRPQLNLPVETKGQLELFQNTVLRPILKFQNDLILDFLHTHPQFIPQRAKINPHDSRSYEVALIKFIKTNNGFRNRLYGMILGMMTLEEFRVYSENASEYNRRIVKMCIQRVLSQVVTGL